MFRTLLIAYTNTNNLFRLFFEKFSNRKIHKASIETSYKCSCGFKHSIINNRLKHKESGNKNFIVKIEFVNSNRVQNVLLRNKYFLLVD